MSKPDSRSSNGIRSPPVVRGTPVVRSTSRTSSRRRRSRGGGQSHSLRADGHRRVLCSRERTSIAKSTTFRDDEGETVGAAGEWTPPWLAPIDGAPGLAAKGTWFLLRGEMCAQSTCARGLSSGPAELIYKCNGWSLFLLRGRKWAT